VDFTRPLPVRLFKAPRTYLDFIVTGTMFRYIIANQRYAIFFLFFNRSPRADGSSRGC
jgi:hypothetical protein